MTTAIIVLASVLGALLVLSLITRIVMRAVSAKVHALVAARYPSETVVLVDTTANHLGLTSKGPVQVRGGNGGLVLTRDALHFLPLVGHELHIPLANVTGVSTVKSHLGKTLFRPLLKVEWTEDSVAFYVSNIAQWIEILPATLTASRAKPSLPTS